MTVVKMSYKVIESSGSKKKLIAEVNALESEDWRPAGGVAMTESDDGYKHYAQAVYKPPPCPCNCAENQGRLMWFCREHGFTHREIESVCTCPGDIALGIVNLDCPVHGGST